MADRVPALTVNMLGSRGLERRSDVTDVPADAALDLLNFDLRSQPRGGRLLSRPVFKRFSPPIVADMPNIAMAANTAGTAFSIPDDADVTIYYRVLEWDGTRYKVSRPLTFDYTQNTGATQTIQVDFSGLAPSSGKPSYIFRLPSVPGGSASDPTDSQIYGFSSYQYVGTVSYPATTFSDNVTDANLGDVLNDSNATDFDPSAFNLQSGLFGTPAGLVGDRTALIDRMLFHRTKGGTYYLLLQAVEGSTRRHYRIPFSVSGDELQAIEGDTLTTFDWAALGDRIWATVPGSSTIYYLDGLRDWRTASQPGQPSAPSLSLAGTSGARLRRPAVGYSWVVQRFKVDTGIMGLPSDPTSLDQAGWDSLTGSASTAKIKVTTSGRGWREKHYVYRTSDGGEFYQLVDEAYGSLVDNTPDEELSVQTVSYDVGAPPGYRYIAVHKGVIFLGYRDGGGKTERSRVIWSNSARPFNFPQDPIEAAGFEFNVNPDDDDEITGLRSFGQALIVFKRRRVFMITGDPPSGFRWDPVPGSDGMGCVGHRTITHTAAGLFWLSPQGVCWMQAPGAKPVLVSDSIREFFTEPQRLAEVEPDEDLSADRPFVSFCWSNTRSNKVSVEFEVKFDDGSNSHVYQTASSSEADLFTANGQSWPSGGRSFAPSETAAILLRPPVSGSTIPGGGNVPVVDVTYTVTARAIVDGIAGPWESLGTFKQPSGVARFMRISTNVYANSFAVDYYPRSEYWLWIPSTGDAQTKGYCDTCYVMDYGPLLSGGQPRWRRLVMPAASAAVSDAIDIATTDADAGKQRIYLFVGSPDGMLFVYPWTRSAYDADIGASVNDDDRIVPATIVASSGNVVIQASGTNWPVTGTTLAGQLICVQAADGLIYYGIVTSNTADVLVVVWMENRQPPAGSCTLGVGAVGYQFDSAWLTPGGRVHTAILRRLELVGMRGRFQATLTARAVDGPADPGHIDEQIVRSRSFQVALEQGLRRVRVFPHVRGHAHQIRCTLLHADGPFEIREATMSIAPTRSRV